MVGRASNSNCFTTLTGTTLGFAPNDILRLTPKFWAFHRDDICAFDISAFSLITIQCNLVAGTLAAYAKKKTEYQDLVKRVLSFDVQ